MSEQQSPELEAWQIHQEAEEAARRLGTGRTVTAEERLVQFQVWYGSKG